MQTQLFAEFQDKEKPAVAAAAPIHSPDSGCFSSPAAPDTSKERRLAGEDKEGNIEDVFQSLLGE